MYLTSHFYMSIYNARYIQVSSMQKQEHYLLQGYVRRICILIMRHYLCLKRIKISTPEN